MNPKNLSDLFLFIFFIQGFTEFYVQIVESFHNVISPCLTKKIFPGHSCKIYKTFSQSLIVGKVEKVRYHTHTHTHARVRACADPGYTLTHMCIYIWF